MRTKQKPVNDAHALWMKAHQRKHRIVRYAQSFFLVGCLCLWELAARFGWIDTFLFGSPNAIAKAFFIYFQNGTIWLHIQATMIETLAGFVLGTVFGILFAVFLWWWPLFSEIMDPFLVVLNALPKTALAPIVIVWFGAGMPGIIAVAISISIIVTTISAYTAFCGVEQEKVRMLQSFSATKWQILWKLILPANQEALLSIAKINMGLCLVGVIVGEFLVSRRGIGYLIVYGSQVFRLDIVMMGISVLAVCAWILNSGIHWLERGMRYMTRLRRGSL